MQGHPTQLLGFFGPRAEGRCGSCWLNGKADKKGNATCPFFKPKVILKFTFDDFDVLRGCLFDGQSGSYFPTCFSKADAAVCIEGDDMNEWIRRGFACGIAHRVTSETKTFDADLWARTRPANNSLPLSFENLGGICEVGRSAFADPGWPNSCGPTFMQRGKALAMLRARKEHLKQ